MPLNDSAPYQYGMKAVALLGITKVVTAHTAMNHPCDPRTLGPNRFSEIMI